jgi:hypothetical protein
MKHVPLRARERADVARLLVSLLRAPGIGRRETGVDRRGRLLVREQDPVSRLLREVAPGNVDVDPARDQDVAKVLTAPRQGPRGYRTLSDRQ